MLFLYKVHAGGEVLIVTKSQIISEVKKEFNSIKQSDLSVNEKLNELVNLRNYLKETYIFGRNYQEYGIFLKQIERLINEIDSYWWMIFTKGEQ